ncbi:MULTISPECIES: TrkH family potassium uptake protein [Zunongwangia]|jgi:trk system potassium uptake protein TrkH|nr:potassium transporter TrkG [Zunongwangia profunda]MAC63744.1 potassium transporter [Flavobacteriaceae bacterium]MAS69089.1 potassium transporter [Zunongwangia sp.]MCC4229156.1 TrkH family potassium uptake protein [Zunongwangia profunda]|tara:strand:- start:3725 stop:5221 length:1497 start_codon:yes stop_codon:yes gene_type:complete
MPKLNFKVILHVMGLLLICNGGFMLLSVLISFIYKDGVTLGMSAAALVTLLIGTLLMFTTRGHRKELKVREGYIIVSFGWIFMALSGSLPYVMTKAIPDFTNAFFETMSGYTTTGASILNDIESIPKGVLFWRSLTHWIGGMGIIVLAIAILPLLGIGGMQLFAAESPGPSADKLKPRITDTAKRLWLIYVSYTAAETLLLMLAGMDFFDAINHAFSTLSTGGFSTKNASMAYWNDNPMIQYIIILFMFLAGSNFVMSYFAFKGRVQRVLQDDEFKWYFYFVAAFTIISSLIVYFQADVSLSSIDHPMIWGEGESAFRHSLFQVLTVITTTGFVSADFTMWTPFLTIFYFGMFFLGGCAGSTAGGVKVMRHIIMIRNGLIEFKRTLHPNAILPVRFNKKSINSGIVFNIQGFFILYMLSFIIGAVVLAALGLDFETAIGGAASSLGNIGPAFGALSPVNNFDLLPDFGKWWCSFLMLIGRLELFTVLIILTPFFWRNR